MRHLCRVIVACALLVSCGNDNDDGSDTVNIQGTFIGDYTATVQPGVVYQGVMQITQQGNSLSGTLTTNAGRSATVSGSVSGTRVTATFTFTDACPGSASSTADITASATRLVGNYTANDCLGTYTGGYLLIKQ